MAGWAWWSQIDGLGHIGLDGVYYNYNNGTDFAQADGLKKLGIEKVPAIATRAVLLDMVGYFGQDPREGSYRVQQARDRRRT